MLQTTVKFYDEDDEIVQRCILHDKMRLQDVLKKIVTDASILILR